MRMPGKKRLEACADSEPKRWGKRRQVFQNETGCFKEEQPMGWPISHPGPTAASHARQLPGGVAVLSLTGIHCSHRFVSNAGFAVGRVQAVSDSPPGADRGRCKLPSQTLTRGKAAPRMAVRRQTVAVAMTLKFLTTVALYMQLLTLVYLY